MKELRYDYAHSITNTVKSSKYMTLFQELTDKSSSSWWNRLKKDGKFDAACLFSSKN